MKTHNRPPEKIDATTGADLMMSQLMAVFAEFERAQRSKRAQAAAQRRKARRKENN